MPSIILSDNGVSSGSAGLKSVAASDGALALQTTTSGGTATTAVSIDTSQNVTFAGYANLPNTFGFKNRLINPGMVIDQRNAGASVTPTNYQYTLDRWAFEVRQASKLTAQQSTTVPSAGFKNSLLVTSSSSYSVISTDRFNLQQYIEGFNVADLNWGSSSAATVTISFWVRSSLTGTFAGSLQNSSQNRSYIFNYTISSANTWEQKTVTIAGDQSGTWATDNTAGIILNFALGTGSTYQGTASTWTGSNVQSTSGAVSVVGTSGATFYITGVQLEKGSTATSFDYRPYGTELQLCQRYFVPLYAGGTTAPYGFGHCQSTTAMRVAFPLPVPMRTTPTYSGGLSLISNGTAFTASGATVQNVYGSMVMVQFDVTGATANQICVFRDSGSSENFSAEL